jgi:heme/copper-type cytochrome/quinol oxidase subunit 4
MVLGGLAVLRATGPRIASGWLLALSLLPLLGAELQARVALTAFRVPLDPEWRFFALPRWMPELGWGLVGSLVCLIAIGLTASRDAGLGRPRWREFGLTAAVTLGVIGLRVAIGQNHPSDAIATLFILLAAIALLLRRVTSAVAAVLGAALVDALSLISLRLPALESCFSDAATVFAALERLHSTTTTFALRLGVALTVLAVLTAWRRHALGRATWPAIALLLSVGSVASLGTKLERTAMTQLARFPDVLGAAGDLSLELPIAPYSACGMRTVPSRKWLVVVRADASASLHVPGRGQRQLERLPEPYYYSPDQRPLFPMVLLAADRRVSLGKLSQALLPLGDQPKGLHLLSAPAGWDERARLGPWLALMPGLIHDPFLIDRDVKASRMFVETDLRHLLLVMVEGERGQAIVLEPRQNHFEPSTALTEPLPLDASSDRTRSAWIASLFRRFSSRTGVLLAYPPETSLHVAALGMARVRMAMVDAGYCKWVAEGWIGLTIDRAGAERLFDAVSASSAPR